MLFAGALAPPLAPLLRLPRVPLPRRRSFASVVFATNIPTVDGPSENPSAARSNRFSASRKPPPDRLPDPASESPSGGALSGSDVLLALQRAVAEKEARRLSEKKRRRGKRRTPTTHGDGGEKGFDLGEQVRAIEIRSDWETQIEELEKRIQGLRSQYQ